MLVYTAEVALLQHEHQAHRFETLVDTSFNSCDDCAAPVAPAADITSAYA
jgi:hypothetical protein